MQVSVPGMYQKPAPYREQIFTYSTALALTGRSAACAPLMATKPAAEPRITLLTIFMLTSKLLCREGSGSAGCNTLRLVPLSLKTRSVASRLRTHPLNARDLSEPPNGTTSGCPPPSQHHNYRRYLHTQQRNCSERCESGRFWKGVAQITRIRDRTFIASLCSIKRFLLGP